jgi:hypothetical protein
VGDHRGHSRERSGRLRPTENQPTVPRVLGITRLSKSQVSIMAKDPRRPQEPADGVEAGTLRRRTDPFSSEPHRARRSVAGRSCRTQTPAGPRIDRGKAPGPAVSSR